MSNEIKKYSDEDEIENVLDKIHNIAWNRLTLNKNEEKEVINDLKRILHIWAKDYLGNNQLTVILDKYYFSNLMTSINKTALFKELDLVVCFFQHYIYAFEEFMTRGFRDSVIRCGLICERLVKRMAVADNHSEILNIPKFEDKINKLKSILEVGNPDVVHLINRMKYVYSKRSAKGAHDTGAAGILIAKSCIGEMPTTYMEYLETLEQIGMKITSKKELIDLVNSTVKVGTTMKITEHGERTKPDTILTATYQQQYFSQPKTFKIIKEHIKEQGHNFPSTTIHAALNRLCKKKILTKVKHSYVQRTPPELYFNEEIVK